MNKPIYKPKGRAGEYGDYAINIYTGCNNGCSYCYAAMMAHRWGRDFTDVRPRDGIVEATRRQLASGGIKGKTIHLCFTCDPYPAAPVDAATTREVIAAIKDSGNHVQILTKNPSKATRDFDLLDGEDWVGTTITGGIVHTKHMEPAADGEISREIALKAAHLAGIKTWVSFEPIFEPEEIYAAVRRMDFVDLLKFGKLNYHPSTVNWGEYGKKVAAICDHMGRAYLIKADLKAEMEAGG